MEGCGRAFRFLCLRADAACPGRTALSERQRTAPTNPPHPQAIGGPRPPHSRWGARGAASLPRSRRKRPGSFAMPSRRRGGPHAQLSLDPLTKISYSKSQGIRLGRLAFSAPRSSVRRATCTARGCGHVRARKNEGGMPLGLGNRSRTRMLDVALQRMTTVIAGLPPTAGVPLSDHGIRVCRLAGVPGRAACLHSHLRGGKAFFRNVQESSRHQR